MISRLSTTETDGREMVRATLRGVSVCVRAGVVDPWVRDCSAVETLPVRGKRVSRSLVPITVFSHGWGLALFGGPVGFVGFVGVPVHILFAPSWRGVEGQAREARQAAGKAMLRLGLHATRARAPFRPLSRLVAPGPLELIAVARHSSAAGASPGALSHIPRSARTHIHIPSVQLMTRARSSTEAQTITLHNK
jgi:hypothetical protein